MELTERDLTLLAHVGRHRFLSSAQLARLDGGSPQGVLRCLRSLFDHGLLDRPRSQAATLLDQGPLRWCTRSDKRVPAPCENTATA